MPPNGEPLGRNSIEKSFLVRFESVSTSLLAAEVSGKQQKTWCEKPKLLIFGKVIGHCEGTEASLG